MVKITRDEIVYSSPYWKIHEVDLESNGRKVTDQCIEHPNSALIVPITEEGNVVMVKEFCAALNRCELFLPKGAIDAGEDPETGAQRELQEEAGLKAGKLDFLGKLTVHPAHIGIETFAFLARDLSENRLNTGNEVEELEVIHHPFEKFEELIESGQLTEARAIAALFLTRKFLKK